MLLNDNEYSLETISEKTNIPVESLEKLANRDWEHFKRAQAIGLISIIEREFKVDLTDFKQEANSYYQEHQSKEPDRTIDLVDAATISGGGNRLVSNIITIVTLCALGYAGWYYFVAQKDKVKIENNTTKESSGMFSNTINSAKELLGNSFTNEKKATETNSSKEKKVINKEPVKGTIAEINSSSETNKSQTISQENKTVELKPVKQQNQPQKFDITTVKEENNSIESQTEKNIITVKEEKPQEEIVVATPKNVLDSNNNNATIKSEVDQLLKEIDENSSQKEENSTEVSIALEENSTLSDENSTLSNSQLDTNVTTPAISKVTFNLKSKRLWIGIYNLNSGKRVSKFVKKPFTLDIGNDKFAIITGHNAFEISSDNGVKRFPKKGKVYLAISADGIKKLTRKEYKELTKRRAW